MKLLLDTHALLWLVRGDQRLSKRALRAIQGKTAENWFSAASLWEIAIKLSIGKLALGPAAIPRLERRLMEDGLHLLPIAPAHCHEVQQLPFHHRDPFDRMLAAQARTEGLRIVSADKIFKQYDVVRVW